MAIQAFLSAYSHLWLFIILFAVIFIILKIAKIPGNGFVLAIISLLVSVLMISSTSLTNFIIQVIPFLVTIGIIIFFLILTLAFVIKDFSAFAKPLAWIGFILAILIILALAFNQFPTLGHLLPQGSNSELSEGMIKFKDFIYSQGFKESIILIVSVVIVGFFLMKK